MVRRKRENRSWLDAVPTRTRDWSWSGAVIGAAIVGGLVTIGGFVGIITIDTLGDVVAAIFCVPAGGILGGLWRSWGSAST